MSGSINKKKTEALRSLSKTMMRVTKAMKMEIRWQKKAIMKSSSKLYKNSLKLRTYQQSKIVKKH